MLKLKTIQKHAALVATFLFIASFWGANVVQAQWEPVGPYQGGISNLNKFGDTLLTFCGKKRAYAAGIDNYLWKRVNGTLPEKSRALIRDKDNLYVLLDSSIANSTDKGVTWTKPNWMKKFEELKCSIASCYIKDSFLLISTSKGVFTSNNYGVDWTRNQFEGENVSGSDIFVSKNTDTLILGSLAKIFISYNRGLNWKKIIIDDKSSDQEVKVPFYYNGDIIISSHDEGLYTRRTKEKPGRRAINYLSSRDFSYWTLILSGFATIKRIQAVSIFYRGIALLTKRNAYYSKAWK